MSLCPFCHPEKSHVIAANVHALALFDAFPVTPGHTLIIPKRHISSLFEATREEQTALLDLLAEMRELLLEERNPAGFNIGIKDGSAAGQTVMHLHIHLIPRYEGDTAGWAIRGTAYLTHNDRESRETEGWAGT